MEKSVNTEKLRSFKNSAKSIRKYYTESEIFRYISHILLSILLGLLAGGGAILFHYLLEHMRLLFENKNFDKSAGLPDYFILFIPLFGGIITSFMTLFLPEIAARRGVLTVIKSIILKKGLIPIKETIFHLFAPIISIGTGVPLGPEGPAAKIGSGIGSYMSQKFNLSKNDMIMYTTAGAGAAISAVFNAPIAGVFFGIEVILLNDLKNRALSALIISSVVADILSRAYLGNVRVFIIPHYEVGDIYTYPFYIALALLCGITALLYFKMSDSFGILLNDKLKLFNPFLRLLPITVLFGFVLLRYEELFGIGYNLTNSVLAGNIQFQTLIILLGLKVIFLVLFIQAGAFGGTFAPSLSIGALLGFAFALFINRIFGMHLNPTAFALVGMGGVLSGINCIPLTSILLVFEVTNDYKFILPLMLASIISYLVIIYFKKGNIYTIALMNENIDMSKRGELDILSKITAGMILHKDMDVVDFRMPFRDILRIIINAKYGDVFVVDGDKKLIGIITLKDIRQALLNNDLVDLLIAHDLIMQVPAVRESDQLTQALNKIKQYDIENIPVVSDSSNDKLVGIITYRDIMQSYNKMLDEADHTEHLTKKHYPGTHLHQETL
ncbi:MAG TPA: chloride channel protein [Spirochaetota bacterium]|nr:chloride channel protein [Spirochaetota bacterium]HPS85440.1 chloride channel protein [Spirochaetota bacterium]